MRTMITALAFLAALGVASAASAQQKDAKDAGASKQRGVITLAEVTIVGRIQKGLYARHAAVSRTADWGRGLAIARLHRPHCSASRASVCWPRSGLRRLPMELA